MKAHDGVTIVDFQSEQTVAAIRAKYKLTQDLLKQIADAKRKLNLVNNNRVTIELQGKSPEEEFRNATLAVEHIEQQYSGARAELVQLFLTERECFEHFRGKFLSKLNQEFAVPAATQFRQLIETAETTINSLIDGLKSLGTSNTSTEIDKFDAGIVSWNKLLAECGGPGNASIDLSNSVRVSTAILFNQSTFNITRLTSAIARFREALESAQRRMVIAAQVKK